MNYTDDPGRIEVMHPWILDASWVDVALLLLLLLFLGLLLLLSILPLLLEAGIVVIVADWVPGAKLNIIMINMMH